jgi:hypothetical protein
MATRRLFLQGAAVIAQLLGLRSAEAARAPPPALPDDPPPPDPATLPASAEGLFRQAGAGAVLRSLEDKARERLSVEDFYQRTSQDQTAWMHALDRLQALGGGVLHAARRPYHFASQVTLDARALRGPLTIAGNGATLHTRGAISALRIEGGATPTSVRVADLSVDQVGASGAVAGFEQVGTTNVTWDCCSVVADQAVAPGYGAWLLRQTEPNNGETGCFWTRFPGSAVRSLTGITVPNGVILDGDMNATDFSGFYISGTENAVLMRYATGSTVPPNRKSAANSVRVTGAWIEGVGRAVRYEGEPGGYAPFGLVIDSRVESCRVLLSIIGATRDHPQPPVVVLTQVLPSVAQLVENPQNLTVNLVSFRTGGGPSRLSNGQGWQLAHLDAAHDVLTLDAPNAGSGLLLSLNGAPTASLRRKSVRGASVADFAGDADGGVGLSMRTVRAISGTQHEASNLRGAVTLQLGGGQVHFEVQEPDADYEVWLQGNVLEQFVYLAKTPQGFQVRSGNPRSTARVNWLLIR